MTKTVLTARLVVTTTPDPNRSVENLTRPVAGIQLLERQLHSLGSAGIEQVTVQIDESQEAVARTILQNIGDIPGVRVSVGTKGTADARSAPELVMPAHLVIDARALMQLVSTGTELRSSVVLVDRYPIGHTASLKSPFALGAPGRNDGAVVSERTSQDECRYVAVGPRFVWDRDANAEGASDGTCSTAVAFLDIGRYGWHPVLNDRDAREATTKVLFATVKPTDGIYAKANRRVSLPISRLLLPLPITPNQVTVATLLCSVFAGVIMSRGTYVALIMGAFVAWWASMMDGVDGELARAKFKVTEGGHWLEMACDYAFYLSMICGYGAGFYRTSGDVKWLYMAGVGSLGVFASFWAVAYAKKSYARREPGGDYYVAFQRTTRAHDASPVQNFTRTMTFLVTRAVFPYYMVLFAVLGITKVMFVFMMVGCQLTWILTLNASRLKPTLTPQAPDRQASDVAVGYPVRAAADES